MSTQSVKRQRANTNGDSAAFSTSQDSHNPPPRHQDGPRIQSILNTFDEKALRETLFAAALQHVDVIALITNRHNDKLRLEGTKTIDFDHYSKTAWHELAEGASLHGSRAWSLGGEVGWSIDRMVAGIREKTPTHSSFGTKKSALVTLRKIGKSVALSGYDEMGSEVTNILRQQGSLDGAMMEFLTKWIWTKRIRCSKTGNGS